MGIHCTRCQGTGFINTHQIEESFLSEAEKSKDFHNIILEWIQGNATHDVSVCDCCGDGECWNYEPGQHSYDERSFNCM